MKEFQWQTEKDWDLLMIYAVVGVHILVGIKHNKAIVSIEVLCLSFYHVDLRLSLLLSSTTALCLRNPGLDTLATMQV